MQVSKKKVMVLALLMCGVALGLSGQAAVQYSNDFENPSSENVSASWPEWVAFADDTAVFARNGRLEWEDSGGNNDWIYLDLQLPFEYAFEMDFFSQSGINGRFSVWPAAKPGESIFDRHNYFLRANTHYFDGADTVPSEGPRDLTLPLGSEPHRLRFEVSGDHVVFLYKDRGEGPWILVDERDFPPFEEGDRFLQLGFNHDSGPGGTHWIDNLVVEFSDEDLFRYANNFDGADSESVPENWSEWVPFAEETVVFARNDRLEWEDSGGNNDWIRLDQEVPENFIMEMDFFSQAGINGRFSVWPLVQPGESIFDRHNYFLRANTHYFDGADTVPSEGPRDLTLPLGSDPHRLRFEVTGDHVVFLYKDQGDGPWILVDERDFPTFGDGPRYVQLGFNHDSGPGGIHWVDNFEIRELPSDRADVSRDIFAESYAEGSVVDVELTLRITGALPSIDITEGLPPNWSAANISNGGTLSEGVIHWSLQNVEESITLSYQAVPPRLIQNRVAQFSGSVLSGGDENRITGDTALSLELDYIFRESIDYDFSGSPQDGRNYPLEHAFGERYTEGMDGLASDVVYARPGPEQPEIGSTFDFPESEDFHHGTGQPSDPERSLPDYRDVGEIGLDSDASDTGASVGGLSVGDWARYSFDLGEEEQVILVNLSVNTWNSGDAEVDVYWDNQLVGVVEAPGTPNNVFHFFTVGPFETTGGEHSLVWSVAGPNAPYSIGRMEVIPVAGIGRVERELTADGFFEGGEEIDVTLTAESLFGNYAAFVDEQIPAGAEVTSLPDGAEIVGNRIHLDFTETDSATSLSYSLLTPEGAQFLLFDGLADIGLPLADPVRGDVSVTNERWLFGEPIEVLEDAFDGDQLADPWFIEYGSDPALDADYQEGVLIEVADGTLLFNADTISMPGKFDEWANGRRAPMILRTDIPEGNWRIETETTLLDTFTWNEYHFGLVVAYNDGDDTDVSGDEYLFGFHSDDLRVELTNRGSFGELEYHEFSEEIDWLEFMDGGNISAKLAVTSRGDSLIFSAQLPDQNWQLVGPPLTETREPTRIGLFSKIWGELNFTNAEYEYFRLEALEQFTQVENWSLY